ncbi:flagellar hook-basal body complex protein [Desulfobacter postgatei]|jgi:flagellar hook protein FlgE|uniref:flagellar hook-basal body complex protein n=1 Tax=Desulfobacter postgatei TaxID=2293 RepID=UPI002A359CE0|nr:flagellar hook-basal body complex protein [Desulfobacter postgatei]MDX9964318.1 flagellar hook-basal body complex protein [Desulfobacter postgatei]
MSLNSSLYAGTSGLGNTGNALQVTSNNISNMNTIGFKKGTASFADTLYQTIGTNAGVSQVGLGMNVDNVAQVFTDGSLETTSNATDLAIGGDGFFVVSDPGSEETYYTRAGNFSFNESGALVTSGGHILQGWYVEGDTGEEYGAITDLILTAFSSPPDATEEITVITNLDADAESKSMVLSNLFEYDEENGTTVESDGYEYQTVVTAYDSLGSSHEVTIYYDKKSGTDWEYVIACDPNEDKRSLVADTDSAGLLARGSITFSESSGDIVSMTMEEFTGVIGNVDISGGNNTIEDVHFEIENFDAIQLDGYDFEILYDETSNTWDFDPAGTLPINYGSATVSESNATTIYINLDGDPENEPDLKISLDQDPVDREALSFDVNNPTELHVQDIQNVVYGTDVADIETTLYINDASVMTTSVAGIKIVYDGADWDWDGGTAPSKYSSAKIYGDATQCYIDLDNSNNDDDRKDIVFTFEEEVPGGLNSTIEFDIEGSTAWRTVTNDEAKDTGYYKFTTDFLGGEFGNTETDISFNIGASYDGNNWINDSLSSTQYARSSSTTYQDSDGYASGDLTGIGVISDGLVSGTYSNGQEIALFKIALADFNNPNGLKNEGGNLYSATTDSGAAITNKPGQNGLGTLSSYALEMSNVDISEEFVSMIELQTAYEANAKIISTVDEMMTTVIGMKR